MIGLWFGAHGEALRYFVLGTGTLMLFFVVWDVTDERFVRPSFWPFLSFAGVRRLILVRCGTGARLQFGKKNPSDASQVRILTFLVLSRTSQTTDRRLPPRSCCSSRNSSAGRPPVRPILQANVASMLTRLFTPRLFSPLPVWALYFFLLAVLVLTAAVIGGIALFRRTPAETWAAAGSFLPT